MGSEVRARRRQMETEFGRMRIRRHGVMLPGADGARFPLDEALELPPDLYALSLREVVALDATDVSYDRTVVRVKRTTSGAVPKRQAEKQALHAAVDFDAFYTQRPLPANDALSKKAFEVASVDGKGITMRPEALRDATRKKGAAAKADRVRGDPMAPRKARRADKRMAVVTANWEQERHKRTANDVLERLGRDVEGRSRTPRSNKAPRPQRKRVAASVENNLATGVAAMFDEMQRRNPDGERRNLVLADGDEDQIVDIEFEAADRKMTVIIILDLIHVIHYLFTIALLLCDSDRHESERWVTRILKQVLTRHPLDVIATIRQTATNRNLSTENRAAVDAAIEYLRKNSVRIDYPSFLREGMPIATGVIEGACRHLVQDRMGITGARWGLRGAESVLRLRAIQTSGDWAEYWAFHLAQERHRNYPLAALAA